jgi:hypothetical protein
MKQENVEKLKKVVENKENIFVSCRNHSEFEAIKDIIFQKRKEYPYTLDFKRLIIHFPCIFRITDGEVKELIPDSLNAISYQGVYHETGFDEYELVPLVCLSESQVIK